MRYYEILTEKVLNLSYGNAGFVRLLICPSASQIEAESDRALLPLYRHNIDIDGVEFRGILDNESMYLWKSHDAVHQEIIKQMGLDEYKITTFECGFGENTTYYRAGGGGFGGKILGYAGRIEDSSFFPKLEKGMQQSRLKMVAYRNSIDPDILN